MKVFLDLDGVLVNFRKGIHDAFNVPYDYSTLSPKWYFWEDWPGIAFNDVNRTCTEAFWQNLEWTHDGERIFKYLEERIDPKNIFLLTTPMPNVGSWTGKMLWIRKHLPAYEKRLIITTAPKHILARPNRLLIDDKDENINEFRQAGGRTIIIARSWNQAREHAQKTFHKLRYDWGQQIEFVDSCTTDVMKLSTFLRTISNYY